MTKAAEHDTELLRVIARSCRRRTLVVTPSPDLLGTRFDHEAATITSPDALDARDAPDGLDTPDTLDALDTLDTRDDRERFDTVVVMGVLDRLPEQAGDRFLKTAWSLVATRGRLVVTVPNERTASDPVQMRLFSARSLRHLLRSLGRPIVLDEQPYRWLAMYVEKRPERHDGPPAGRLSRYRAISRLCRGRVIELGCGAGELTASIGERGLEVVGVDINQSKIEAARQRYPHLRFEREDICRTSAPPASFDTVVLAEVLEHVTDAVGGQMLDTAWRLLRPGGRFVVSVPNENCIPHPNHIRTFSSRSLRDLLRPLGQPCLVSDQPYKWLLMYVNKPATEGASAAMKLETGNWKLETASKGD